MTTPCSATGDTTHSEHHGTTFYLFRELVQAWEIPYRVLTVTPQRVIILALCPSSPHFSRPAGFFNVSIEFVAYFCHLSNCAYSPFKKKKKAWYMAGQMAQRINVFSAQTDDLSSVPEPHAVEGKTRLQVILGLPHVCHGICLLLFSPPPLPTWTGKMKKLESYKREKLPCKFCLCRETKSSMIAFLSLPCSFPQAAERQEGDPSPARQMAS